MFLFAAITGTLKRNTFEETKAKLKKRIGLRENVKKKKVNRIISLVIELFKSYIIGRTR